MAIYATIKKLIFLSLNVGWGLRRKLCGKLFVCAASSSSVGNQKCIAYPPPPPPPLSAGMCQGRERVGQEVFEQRRKRNPTTGLFLSVLSPPPPSPPPVCAKRKGLKGKNFMQRLSKLQNVKKTTHQLFRPYKIKIVLISICENIFVVLFEISTMH